MKTVVIGLGLSMVSLLALADGPQHQYEQAAVNQAALDPNEALINDDGATEDPSAKMTGTARAYRNGYYNGKKAQREEDNHVPPLPPGFNSTPRVVAEDDQSRYTSIPPQPLQAAPVRVQRPSYLQQTGPVPGGYPPPPVNVYVQQAPVAQVGDPDFDPQQWVNAQMQQPVYAPRPEPVYTQPEPAYYAPPPGPPPSTYVVIRGIPPTLATGYWPRGYYPHYAVQPRYYPRYYRPY